MRKPLLGLALLLTAALHAQTAFDTNLGSKLTVDTSTTPPTFSFSWWGKSGCNYIVETNPDLLSSWTFLPDFNPSGTDSVLGIQYTTDADKYFFRAIQFDPNDLPASMDSDGDGLPDKWELYYFGDLSKDASYDPDGDGIKAIDAYAFGLNPTQRHDTEADVTRYTYTSNDELSSLRPVVGSTFSYNPDSEGNLKP